VAAKASGFGIWSGFLRLDGSTGYNNSSYKNHKQLIEKIIFQMNA